MPLISASVRPEGNHEVVNLKDTNIYKFNLTGSAPRREAVFTAESSCMRRGGEGCQKGNLPFVSFGQDLLDK